ncbi:MAG: NADH:ubiquinone oxidoreductase [Planctomycetes bacterium]|nr:NADH:ubiquinone oxidoreductase [Planctomycetota bacterium]NOG53780.1 NADH:ubiquinone oxidoreductase [Planctomycetota bacterium]
MHDDVESTVQRICQSYDNDGRRLMDIVTDLHREYGCVDPEAMDLIARCVNVPRLRVQSLVSFYSFYAEAPRGRIVIRLSDDVIDRMHGYDRVAAAFCDELGIGMGETTADGLFTLERTACIGMCDQAPAGLVNDVVITHLSSDKARQIVQDLRRHGDPHQLVTSLGDGENGCDLIHSMVRNNLRKAGSVIFSPINRGEAIRKALSISPQEVIRAMKTARLRGRGGAGFPAGMKWEFARGAGDGQKYILCNADEGEPGTFKDRVILTERADRVFAGMTIAGYAIGASEGIMYLRAEYAYLKPHLEDVLRRRRIDGLLGETVLGRNEFAFDIRIQIGAGAYVCGEETALISSCEGKRGDPMTRPPFPAQKGYNGCPTVINNVETLCCVTKIMEEGPATFSDCGSDQSSGTKLLSISGDCKRAGVYEFPFGTTLREVLNECGGLEAQAVQVGGPSGKMVSPADFDRKICFEDLATGGSVMVFGPQRNILDIVHGFMDFFVDESCGYCTPCRVGNVLLKQLVERVRDGSGEPDDLDQMRRIAGTMKATSRCGLGQTSSNPVMSTLTTFETEYTDRVQDGPDGQRRGFDLAESVKAAESIAGRPSVHTGQDD